MTRRARNWRCCMDVMPKGEFIRRYGRAFWDAVPRNMIFKDGRRMFVAGLWIANIG